MPKDTIIDDFDVLFPASADQSCLLVSCPRSDYSASLLARAVEDCDAQVINLNVTSLSRTPSDVVVALRINHRNPEAAVRSLERYGYEVVEAAGRGEDNASMRSRADEVLRYLDL